MPRRPKTKPADKPPARQPAVRPPPPGPAAASAAYVSRRQRIASRDKTQSRAGRDIGALPGVVDPARKAAAVASFRTFCESYFPATFSLPWSADHLRVIAAIERSVRDGGLYAFAMPRGSGKTSLVECAATWALFCGYRDFVAIVGADEEHARTMLESIKVECETNDELLADFPEVVFPIVALERIHQRANGQLFDGQPTHIHWTANEVQFPTIPGSRASGGIIRVAGITGRIRGMSAKRACDGRKVRPSLVLIDDPQTDESAASPSQVASRENVLKGAILGLAGPGATISGLCTVTVVRPDDLADRLLDRVRHPAWQGERTRLVYQWPTDETAWAQYADLRRDGQRSGEGTAAADAFYAAHRDAMDAGAVVAWPERKNPDELSAIQHAFNLRIDRGDHAFWAEFQNEPKTDDADAGRLVANDLSSRTTTLPRGVVPLGHQTLTAFVDVQDRVLYWLLASWGETFGGHVVAYGAYPEQPTPFFEASAAKRTLAMVAKGAGFEGALHAGLTRVAETIAGQEWKREDGAAMRVAQILIDANWGQSTSTVRTFARRSPFASLLLPSHGRGIPASSQPITERGRGRGDRLGLNWRVGQVSAGQRSALYDTNFWKSFVAGRLRLAAGDPDAILFHKGNHDLLVSHLSAEYPVRAEARGRVVDEWKLGGRENHFFDCLVGCAVAASIAGVRPTGTEAGPRARRRVEIPTGPDGKRIIQVKRATA